MATDTPPKLQPAPSSMPRRALAGVAKFRPGVQELEDRTVPASLVSNSTAFEGVDAPIVVLGVSEDGQQVLLQSVATNVVPGQVDVPGTNDLFFFNRSTGQRSLITAFDPPGTSSVTAGTKAVNASISTPGVLHNAVISADGSRVVFMSGTDATLFDSTIPAVADGGGEDAFAWDAATGKISLVSRDQNDFALGSYSVVTSPSVSADGDSAAFVSTTSAHFSYDSKFLIIVDPATPHPFGSPNLYRTDIDATPVPVSYDGPFSDGSYFFYDNVSVDPLGRYASGDGVSFVTMNQAASFFFPQPGDPVAPAFGKDATRFTFAGGGFGAAPLATVLSTPAAAGVGNNFFGTGIGSQGLGTVNNAFVARDRSDIVFFTATVTGGTGTDIFGNPVTQSGELVTGYVNNNGGTSDFYRATFAGLNANIELVSAAAGTTNVGLDGTLDAAPGAFGVTPNGTRAYFVTTGTTAVTGITDRNKAFDIFQRNFDTGEVLPISVTANNPNRTGFGAARFPSQTTDGLIVAFESTANDLTGIPDSNGQSDVFVRDLGRNVTSLASIVPGNFNSGTGRSFGPVIGGNFRSGQVYFSSTATDLDRNLDLDGVTPQIFVATTPLIANGASRIVGYSGGVNGFVAISSLTIDGVLVTTTKYQPFGVFAGEIRVATGDVTGDGVPDLIVGAGAGGGPRVQVIDGFTNRIVDDFFAFESSFTGGVYVGAGDFNADGRVDLIVGAGETGGPRVQVYDSATRRLVVDAFAYEAVSRTGVHVAAGDYSGDGIDDLVVAAGNGGGPRVRVFDGAQVPTLNILTDFFAFDPTSRSGAYVSLGDFDNDGRADIATGTGPGVESRIRIYNAANLVLRDPNVPITFRDFSPFGAGNSDGARAVLRDIEGLVNQDIVVGNASGLPRIASFSGNTFGTAATAPAILESFIPFGEDFGQFGAFVG